MSLHARFLTDQGRDLNGNKEFRKRCTLSIGNQLESQIPRVHNFPICYCFFRVIIQEIKALLAPILEPEFLSMHLLDSVSLYLELLLKWNAKVNLTAVREPREIVTRHFGESFFAAQQIRRVLPDFRSAIDVGSGAGFPGLPMKILLPGIELTLIESNQKKVAFLREAIRLLQISGVSVFSGRAEDFKKRADVVALRAVEKFDAVLPIAAQMLNPTAALCLWIGSSQISAAKEIEPNLSWNQPIPLPFSDQRALLLGRRGSKEQ